MLDDLRAKWMAYKHQVYIAVLATDALVDAYFNGVQAKLEALHLAKPVQPQERKPKPLGVRVGKAFLWAALAYLLLGQFWGWTILIVLLLVIWITKDLGGQIG